MTLHDEDVENNRRRKNLEIMLNEQAARHSGRSPYSEEKPIPLNKILIYVFSGGFFLIFLQLIHKYI